MDHIEVGLVDNLVRITEYQDKVRVGVTSVPLNEWAAAKQHVVNTYNTKSRADLIRIIAGLHITYEDR